MALLEVMRAELSAEADGGRDPGLSNSTVSQRPPRLSLSVRDRDREWTDGGTVEETGVVGDN